jgi:iron complex transport system ATP-binding protein
MARLGRTQVVISVLHDLGLALAADRMVVLAAGEVRSVGRCDEPQVQAALVEVFGGAIRIERVGGQWVALPWLG